MKFECGDLERGLANPDLMPEARKHLATCAACRREFRLWMDISAAAKGLREEWDTPGLWPQILGRLEAERKPVVNRWKEWKTWAMAAALLVVAGASLLLVRESTRPANVRETPSLKVGSSENRDFLTEQALREVEKSESAYRKSIERLSRLAEPKLEDSASATAVNAREKLLMLDSAISDTRNNVAFNRFNVSLQKTLAKLYREKQRTLEELLTSDQNN
jgi:hypothetical protein